jgi:citrate lyase subunit beta/citryl-CoA lyase
MRSLLFVPGDSRRKLDKGLTSGADALLVDLEDSVALDAKEEARRVTAAFLSEAGAQSGRPRLYVRVNGLTTGLTDADLDGVMQATPDGIVLPKTVGGSDVSHLGAKLAVREAEYGLPDGGTRILAIATENALGVFALGTFAGASHRLMGLAWGGEDLSADLGAEANRGDDGAYAEPYRIARSLTPWELRPRRSIRSTRSTPTSATWTASRPSAVRRGATASWPRWRSIRRRCR